MAKTAIAVTGRTASDFEGAFDAALAGVLASRIDIISFTVTELTRLQGVEYRALVIADNASGATITKPYKAALFVNREVVQLAADIQDWYNANPTYFAAPPVMFEGQQTRLLEQTFALVVYNEDKAEGQANWSSGTAGNVGQVSGDLAGTSPAPTVEGIQGRSIGNTAGASGDVLMFNGSGITWVQEVKAFATGADAAADAPLVNGRRIVITTGADQGFWQVTTNNGAAFPADYTQLTTSATMAADWNVADGDNLFQGTDGETISRELVAPPTTLVAATPATLNHDDHVAAVDPTAIGGVATVNLPAAPVADERHIVCDATGGAGSNSINVNGNGNTINGQAVYTINFPFGSATFQWDSFHAEWRVLAGYLEQPRTKLAANFPAGALSSPQNSDWAINALAGLGADNNNPSLSVRFFSDAAEEGVGFELSLPEGATRLTLTLWSRAQTPPGVTGVAPQLYAREFAPNSAPTVWAGTLLSTVNLPDNQHFQKFEQTLDLSSLGLSANTVAQFELTRSPAEVTDTLTGDWLLLLVEVKVT